MANKTQIHYSPSGNISACGTTTDPEKLTDNLGIVTCTRCLKTKAALEAAGNMATVVSKSEAVELVATPQTAPIESVMDERNAFEIVRELQTIQVNYFAQIAKATVDSDGMLSAEMSWMIRSLLGASTHKEFLVWLHSEAS